MTAIRVVLIDDHALVRHGLAALLATDGRFEVVAEAGDGEAGLEAIGRLQPDVAILDLSMPGVDGLETLRRLRGSSCTTGILVLTMYDEETFIARALAAGADGYLLKHAMDDELFDALVTVAGGRRYLSRTIDPQQIDARCHDPLELTDRELQVLHLIAKGMTTQRVAEALSISPHTATRHRANLMQKLGAHNQVELVRAATARGLIFLKR